MHINLDFYRINIPNIRNIMERRKNDGFQFVLSNIVEDTSMPIIAACCYMAEILGNFTPEISDKLKFMKNFDGGHMHITGCLLELPDFS